MAKWIYNEEKDSYCCEKCGSKAPADPTLIGYDFYTVWLSDYCPQCGEKMEEDENG